MEDSSVKGMEKGQKKRHFKDRNSLILKIDDLSNVSFFETYGPVTFKMANNKMLLLIRHPIKCHMERLTLLKNARYSWI